MFARKPRLRPAQFLITSAKRLLQHNRHLASNWTDAPNGRFWTKAYDAVFWRELRQRRMMLWTAPALRHRSAIGWLGRNATTLRGAVHGRC
jgi:hypothetical protein